VAMTSTKVNINYDHMTLFNGGQRLNAVESCLSFMSFEPLRKQKHVLSFSLHPLQIAPLLHPFRHKFLQV